MKGREIPDGLINLPLELGFDIVTKSGEAHLLSTPALVSKAWHELFHNIYYWKHQIKTEFKISDEMLNQFPFEKSGHFYRHLYVRLDRLFKQSPRMSKHLQYTYQSNLTLLVACCGDNAEYTLEMIPREEYEIWLKISLFASCNELAMALFKRLETISLVDFLKWTIKAGNLNLTRGLLFMLLQESVIDEHLTYELFQLAACSGNLKLFKYLVCFFEKNPPIPGWLPPIPVLVKNAVDFGNKELVVYLLECREKMLETKYEPHTLIIESAMRFGNIDLVYYLLNYGKENPTQIDIPTYMLEAVATSGNLQLMQRLLPTDKEHSIDLDTARKIFYAAAKSGNITLMRYVQTILKLDWEKMLSDKQTVIAASYSGYLPLMKLLRNYIDFSLHEKEILLGASVAGNRELLLYLFHPDECHFKLTPRIHEEDNIEEIEPVISCLITCHFMMNENALLFLQAEQFTQAKKALNEAFDYSPSLFYFNIALFLQKPDTYQLSDTTCHFIKEFLTDLANKAILESWPRIEKERILQVYLPPSGEKFKM